MGDVKHGNSGAPPLLGGLVSAGLGRHAVKETGTTDSGKTVTGYGHTEKEANQNYQKQGGRS